MKTESKAGDANKGRTRGWGEVDRSPVGEQKLRGWGKTRVWMLKITGKPKTKGWKILRILAMDFLVMAFLVANTISSITNKLKS